MFDNCTTIGFKWIIEERDRGRCARISNVLELLRFPGESNFMIYFNGIYIER